VAAHLVSEEFFSQLLLEYTITDVKPTGYGLQEDGEQSLNQRS
jgi:hypothetical protein